MVTLKKLKELKQIKRDNKVIYNLLNNGYYLGTAHKFKFEGHDYISFTKGHGVAVVHNPKCHCNLNEDY